MTSILAIHPGALGDVLLAVPALRALRRDAAAGGLTLAAQPRIGALLVELGVTDTALPVDALRLDALFVDDADLRPAALLAEAARVVCWFGARDEVFRRRLREIAPSAVVAAPWEASVPTVWEHLLTGVRARTPVSARGLTTGDARALRPPGEPEVKLARSVVDDWSGPGEAGTVPLLRRPVELAAKLVEAGRCALVDAGWDGVTPLVLVHPGAGGVAKRWPVPDFARVLARLGETSPIALAIHAGPADHDAATALRDLLGAARRSAPPLVLWEPGLGTLAGALACADLYLGNDSGVSHLAAAVGTPSLVLFMPESLRWVPWSHTARPLVVSSHGGEAEAGAVLAAAARAMPRRATTRGAAGRAPCPTAAPA